ncbi:hypothetical protein N7454_009968 [Penicillium verhagenii]|nr:hypothetical protein N7454_009968 [Penicillium verhagenii]
MSAYYDPLGPCSPAHVPSGWAFLPAESCKPSPRNGDTEINSDACSYGQSDTSEADAVRLRVIYWLAD